jgi:hypothetical protein
MDVAQPLSSDAKVHSSQYSLKYYLTCLTAWHINNGLLCSSSLRYISLTIHA